ncbi:unnamed protein product [Rhizoctonia solani]|uniref:DUF6699 domain-containing protein n=1 Tax=Rhizoctonia solani TaxID=456999 RepID=A0A8H3E7K4_9AGAM|nr:unnamed protein product [Rhizoctonia solani]
MSRTGPPHYHQGSSNLCHCAFTEVYHNPEVYHSPEAYHTPAPYVYTGRPRPIAGHPSEYGPAIRRIPKPKPTNKTAKSRDMKFDEDSQQWFFETTDAPGIKWLESVRHIEDLPQAKDSDFLLMLNEYYMAGHVVDMPDQERLPVVPGGPGKSWRYKRAAPPAPVQKQQHPPAPSPTWIEPVYHSRYPAAPQYAGGSAHPVSMRLPSNGPPHEWRAPPEFARDPDTLEALRLDGPPIGKHGRSATAPNVPTTYERVEIHRLLQTRTTLGVARMPDLVFDLRYDPRHAFDRSEDQKDLTTAPAFQPSQKFVRILIRHPFGGRGGDWVEDVDDAQYLTVMGVLRIISDMVHRSIDQNLDWDPLSEFDKSFVYEAYLNRPCPDEDAAGRRLHLFCEKFMLGGIEQLPPKAKGTTAEGPTFAVKLIKNSKLKRYDKLSGFRIPSGKGKKWAGRGETTYPYLTDDMASSR